MDYLVNYLLAGKWEVVNFNEFTTTDYDSIYPDLPEYQLNTLHGFHDRRI